MIANANRADAKVETTDHEVTVTRDDRRYRVRGLTRNTSYDQLKINLMVSRDGLMHVDTLDLYDARRRITFCKQAAAEVFVDEVTIKEDLGHVLLQLEQRQQELIAQAQASIDAFRYLEDRKAYLWVRRGRMVKDANYTPTEDDYSEFEPYLKRIVAIQTP